MIYQILAYSNSKQITYFKVRLQIRISISEEKVEFLVSKFLGYFNFLKGVHYIEVSYYTIQLKLHQFHIFGALQIYC